MMLTMLSGLILLLLTSVIAIFVALVVALAHNVNKWTKISFIVVCLSLSLWQFSIFAADNVVSHLFFWNNFVFVWPSIAAASSFVFVALLGSVERDTSFREIVARNVRSFAGIGILTTVQALAIVSNNLFTSIQLDTATKGYLFERGFMYPTYIFAIVIILCIVASKLIVGFRASEKGSQERQAFKVVLAATIVTMLYGVVTNILIPALAGQKFISFGVFSVDIFALGLAFSIFRYRFLDIRSYVFRAVAYIMTFSLAAIIYVATTSLLATHVLHVSLEPTTWAVLSCITLVTAVLFQPLKTYFNKITNRLFYRDYYDSQEFFNEFNELIVSTIDLDELLDKVVRAIEKTLKTDSCLVVLKQRSPSPRIVGDKKVFDAADLKQVHSSRLAARPLPPVIVTDLLSREEGALKKILNKNDIALLARLGGGNVQELGHIVIGPKKSGNPYAKQDIRVIEAVANELVIAIQNALRFEEIEQFNETLQQRVETATRKLRKTNEKLRLLDETKDDFIGMASHQLRTPLTSVKGYLSLVLDGDAGPVKPAQGKLLNQAYISSQRMVYLIADLLNVSRLRTGKFVIEPSPVNLANLIEDEISQVTDMAQGRSLTLTYHKPPHFPTLNLDETKTRQVVMNFIDNAIHYTPPGGHITVSLEDKPETVELRVTDDGIGVPKIDQHHLFTKFYRAKNAQKARPDGTGLGLFMAKKVIVAQGGATIFDSKEGKGSTFGFSFPKAALAHQTKQKTLEALKLL